MSSGTTLHFISYSKDPIPVELYEDYLNQVKNSYKDDFFNKSVPIYPSYFRMDTDNGEEIVIFNEHPSEEKPDAKFLHIAQNYSTDFNSSHMILADFWDLDQYDSYRNQHVISDSEVAQLLPVCEYVSSDLVKHKDAARFEKAMLSENQFLETFLDHLPSRQYPKEYASDDGELHEEEDCLMYFCRMFSIFMRFYIAMDKEFDLSHRNYALIYTKWG